MELSGVKQLLVTFTLKIVLIYPESLANVSLFKILKAWVDNTDLLDQKLQSVFEQPASDLRRDFSSRSIVFNYLRYFTFLRDLDQIDASLDDFLKQLSRNTHLQYLLIRAGE